MPYFMGTAYLAPGAGSFMVSVFFGCAMQVYLAIMKKFKHIQRILSLSQIAVAVVLMLILMRAMRMLYMLLKAEGSF